MPYHPPRRECLDKSGCGCILSSRELKDYLTSFVLKMYLRFLFSSVAVFLALLTMTGVTHCGQVLFWDDFEDGNSNYWEVVEFGYGEVVEGAYCLVTACEP